MESVLKTSGLTKIYGGRKVVNQVSMNVCKGDIYGFIGKNGAGKTTLIRMIVGLAKPDAGSIELFGSSDLIKQRSRIGTVIEYPAVFPHMTAEENLETQCRLLGIHDKTVIKKTLDTVGLPDTGNKKACNFSLGMKQRLAIAVSLLGNPDFLFLDEPTNGLDPTGIKEIRELIQKLNQEHSITVLISSHILGELSKLATRYGIINQGSLIEEFTAEELENRCNPSINIIADDADKTCNILKNEMNLKNIQKNGDGSISILGHLDQMAQINSVLCQNGILVESISAHHTDLEEYFIEATGRANK